jgi:trk system potassium uptake protein TrkA
VGLGFDRDVLEEAGIKEADAFLAVSSGDNSNILSARVAREHYHVPSVIARIYDPMRAEIYERLNIPTVSTTRWGVKQMILMLSHTREEIKESLAGGDLLRMRIAIPQHLLGTRVTDLNDDGKLLVAGVDRGGSGFIPVASSTFQQGDYAALVVQKDSLETLDESLKPVAEH